jgi:hypothetical protein
MHKRQAAVIITIIVAAISLFTITSFRQEAQSNKPQEDEATIIQKGEVTDEEREYSKEYKKLYSYRKGRKLSEVGESSKNAGNTKEIRVIIGVPDTVTVGDEQVPTISNFLKNLSCEADVIVIGSIKKATAHLTDDETFVYTKYEFSVQEVLKNNPIANIEINSNIQITRPGGLIKLNNQIIRAEDLSYETLQKNKEYLLFLRFVPSVKGYVVSSPKGDFILDNKSFKKLTKLESPEELANKNSQSLVNDIHNSILSGCNNNLTKGEQ